ncbi:DegT/DnrJ/EryC1/StrS family aminotransferase [Planomonospora parontospora]|uniref:DegT/DnrJ/EryC1/StrS family aminotransferase n=1 Tax=Planomonospora parontospora TaxID=58119 RepID=UPI0016714327|nr:DegT/DnrJ/EryC1/StrS family aminotransferase [Planomonospora parontospora]
MISDAAVADVMAVLESGALARFYGGAQVRRFEQVFAAYFGRRHAIAVSSGTAALHLAYLAARLPAGSEALVPANAYVSAVSALIQAEIVPVLVDIDPLTWAMDPADCERKLTGRTRMIVPVHMYGQPCPMPELVEFAARHDLVLVEDCGQSHGALSAGQPTGTFGRAAAFSLCCRKHVAIGEGGMVVTDDDVFAETVRSLAHKGKGEGWFDYREMGYSYNLTEIQAVLGLHQTLRLDDELCTRSRWADLLREELADVGLSFPTIRADSTHAYFKLHALVPEETAPRRNEIVDAIRAEGVGCDPSHPCLSDIAWLRDRRPSLLAVLPEERRPDYRPSAVPVADDLLARQLCIELGPGLDGDDIEAAGAAVRKVMAYFQRASSAAVEI